MTKIYPEGMSPVADSAPLSIDKTKNTEMVAKAKELLTEPMEAKDLADALEQYYVFEENEHYTSDQLAEIVKQVQTDLAPEPVAEEVEL